MNHTKYSGLSDRELIRVADEEVRDDLTRELVDRLSRKVNGPPREGSHDPGDHLRSMHPKVEETKPMAAVLNIKGKKFRTIRSND